MTSISLYLKSPYLGNKDKCQDDSSTNEKPSAEESRKCIDKILQGVGSDNNDCKHNASHIDCCCNILGIIKSLDLHLASCKGKNKGNNLQHHLVAIQDTQEYIPGCGAADICEVESDNFPFLEEKYRCRERGHGVKCIKNSVRRVTSKTDRYSLRSCMHQPTPSTFIRFSLLGTRMAVRFPWTPSTMVYTRRISTSTNTNTSTPRARYLSCKGCVCMYTCVEKLYLLLVALSTSHQLVRLMCNKTKIHKTNDMMIIKQLYCVWLHNGSQLT